MTLGLIPERPQEWKWAILACHSALQGIFICALSGTDGIGCLDNRSITRVHEWLEESRTDAEAKPPRERVADLPSLLDRTHDVNFMSWYGGAPVPNDADADRDIRSLNDIRNQFTHFPPMSWSIEVTGLPRLINVSMTYGHRILMGHPACTVHLNNERLQMFVERFAAVSQALQALGAEGFPDIIRQPDHLIRRP